MENDKRNEWCCKGQENVLHKCCSLLLFVFLLLNFHNSPCSVWHPRLSCHRGRLGRKVDRTASNNVSCFLSKTNLTPALKVSLNYNWCTFKVVKEACEFFWSKWICHLRLGDNLPPFKWGKDSFDCKVGNSTGEEDVLERRVIWRGVLLGVIIDRRLFWFVHY